MHLDALDSVAFSGTKAEGWYLPAVQQAMEEGKIAYAGKYSAPDYEQILAAGCCLAIENTMILHTPEVKEQLEHFGIPVLVERSSYESDPLARMEWIKLYGILLGREEQAEQVFSAQETAVQPILSQKPTGKSCAFFSLTTNNLATVRKGSDYVARMIEMAGGSYVFADLTDNGNSLATMNLPLEDFYAGAKDADVLIYNSAIEGHDRIGEPTDRAFPAAERVQSGAERSGVVHHPEPVPAEHGAGRPDRGHEPGVYRGHTCRR